MSPALQVDQVEATEPELDFEWAIVEVYGHQKFAGKVSKQLVLGVAMLRIDVPDLPAIPKIGRYGYAEEAVPKFTKFLGANSIFSITPVAEEVALAAARSCRSAPTNVVSFPALPAPAEAACGAEEDDDDDVPFDDRDFNRAS